VVLSGLQDQLAPLKSWLFPRRVYLQLEDHAFKAMVLDGDHVAWLEQVSLPEGLCVNGQPMAVEALGDLLGDLLVERGFPGARVKAVLPRAATTWRVIEWPQSKWPDEPELLVRQQQLDLALPWSLQQADLFLEPLGAAPPRSLLVAVQRDVLESWIEVFNQAGVVLDGLEALSICLWRAVKSQLGTGVQVLLQLGSPNSRLLALDQDQPLGDWALPSMDDPKQLEEALQRWCERYEPSGGIVTATEAETQAMLPELEHLMRCPLIWSPHGRDELPLWGLVQAEIKG
jgi:Tfp pilus assembly PilM family ATPase